eukprot:1143092-Pelagomonas_calceolata.AAC.1
MQSILAKDDFTTSVIPVENFEDIQEYCRKENLGETEVRTQGLFKVGTWWRQSNKLDLQGK